MGIVIKSPAEIKLMKQLGKKHSQILKKLYDFVQPGVDAIEIERYYNSLLREYRIKSACKGYQPKGIKRPFPSTICISLSGECVHSYPRAGRKIKATDIVVIDTVVTDGKVYTDAAFTKVMDKAEPIKKKLSSTARQALIDSLEYAKAGNPLGMISYTIERTAKDAGFDVLYDYGGHGIGLSLWEEPFIPNFGRPGEGPELKEGMTLAVETLLVTGSPKVMQVDEWATRLADGGYFAQWEATVLVTKRGYDVIAGLI